MRCGLRNGGWDERIGDGKWFFFCWSGWLVVVEQGTGLSRPRAESKLGGNGMDIFTSF